MRKTPVKFIAFLILLMLASCDEPETIVTDQVHSDGSVTRKIEMRSSKNKFDESVMQVPYDSTWVIRDSCEVSLKGDTTWIRRAEKIFGNIDEINAAYRNDSSSNGKFPRHVSFSRKFNWFNNSYRFSEIVDRRIKSGYSIRNFLNDDELSYFYSPDNFKSGKLHGPDSLRYKSMADSIDRKTWNWSIQNVTALWIDEFSRLVAGKAGPELSADSLRTREREISGIINEYQEAFDSLWSSGFLLKKIIGEPEASKFKVQADSALSLAINPFLIDYKNYSVRIVMPGKLTTTNGYLDSARNLIWPVNADLFLSDQYEMWAESKTTNIWAWFVSGLFVVFVFAGILIKKKVPPVGRD
jgi:hypothetical protein